MSMNDLDRRRFLTASLALVLAPLGVLAPAGLARGAVRRLAAGSPATRDGHAAARSAGAPPDGHSGTRSAGAGGDGQTPADAPAGAAARPERETRSGSYEVDVGILHDLFSFHLPGTLTETIDRTAGRYEVTAVGRGGRIANRVESRGVRRDGRWAPVEATGWFQVAGRESKSEIHYDYDRRVIEYHFRGETFLLRRLRVADDVLPMPAGGRLDDVISATLNFAEGTWPPDSDGVYRTHVVRRRRAENEGPDDVEPIYRAELVPFAMKVGTDRTTGRPATTIDLSPFSSWAVRGKPARVVFGADRRPERIAASLVLGTSITIRLRSTS